MAEQSAFWHLKNNDMNKAEKYLIENKAGTVFVRYQGRKRRLFFSSHDNVCMVRRGHSFWGKSFSDWEGVTKVYIPDTKTDKQRKLVSKYKREARKATFTNSFIRQCLQAKISKSLFENGITTGSWNEGGIISLASLSKVAPFQVETFAAAFKQRKPHVSWRFPFLSYECFMEVTVNEQGEATGRLTLEFKGYFYYYLLINDKNFISCDID